MMNIELLKTRNLLSFVLMFLCLSLLTTSCTEDDPSITEVRLCESFPADENVCADDTSIIPADNPTLNVSCKLLNANDGDFASFTLNFEQEDGTLTEIVSSRQQLSGDTGKFNGHVKFSLPDGFTSWGVGSWQIKIELESEVPISATKLFTTI